MVKNTVLLLNYLIHNMMVNVLVPETYKLHDNPKQRTEDYVAE